MLSISTEICAKHSKHKSNISFTEYYQEAESKSPTVLEMQLKSLNLILMLMNTDRRSVEENPKISRISHLAFRYGIRQVICTKTRGKIVFNVDTFKKYKWHAEENRRKVTKFEIADEIFNSLISLAKDQIHKSFRPEDAVVIIRRLRPYDTPELLMVWKDGVVHYETAFRNIQEPTIPAHSYSGSKEISTKPKPKPTGSSSYSSDL